MASVTQGAISQILQNNHVHQPVLQVLHVKTMPSNRYRLLLSDGKSTITGMLATQLHDLVENKSILDFSVIRLTDYITNSNAGTMILVVLGSETIEHLSAPIAGTPNYQSFDREENASRPPQYDAPQQQYQQNQQNQPPPYGSNNVMSPNGGQQNQGMANTKPPQYQQNQNQTQNQNQSQYNPQNQGQLGQSVYGNQNQAPPQYGQAPPQYGQAQPQAQPQVQTQPQNQGQGQGQNQGAYGSSSNNNNGNNSNQGAYGGSAYGGQANSRPVARDDGAVGNIVPISAINPYSNKWTIKARVTNKSDIRRWSNAKGEGHLFSIDLMDSAGTEIRGTFFKEACDKFQPMLEEGKVYTFSQGKLKVVTNKQFTTIKNNYELTFDNNSDIKPCQDTSEIKTYSFNFVPIANLATAEVNHLVDLLGIVRSHTECVELVSQKLGGKVLFKRELTVYDQSNTEVRLTLWGDKAQESPPFVGSVIAVKSCKLSEYQGGKSLGITGSTTIMINPEIDEGQALYEWNLKNAGTLPPPASLSGAGVTTGAAEPLEKRKCVSAIREESMGLGEKPDHLTIKATVNYIKHDSDPWYTSCPNPAGCLKKVTLGTGEMWNCEKCNLQYDNCVRRYVLTLTATDQSGQVWLSLFNETAIKLLGGFTADQLYEMKVAGNEQQYEQICSDALFKTYLLRVRVKQEMVNEEPRIKSTVLALEELDYLSECRQMIDAINKYN